jgi:hypothetical protein
MTINRNVGRQEISDLINQYNFADSFTEQVALTDIVMDQLSSIPVRDLTLDNIRSTIEQELTVWENMKNSDVKSASWMQR